MQENLTNKGSLKPTGHGEKLKYHGAEELDSRTAPSPQPMTNLRSSETVPDQSPRKEFRPPSTRISTLPITTNAPAPTFVFSDQITSAPRTNTTDSINASTSRPITTETSRDDNAPSTSFSTLEPYSHSTSRGRGRGGLRSRGRGQNRNNRPRNNYYREEFPPLNSTSNDSFNFKKFYLIKASNPEITNLSENFRSRSGFGNIKANLELERMLKGQPRQVTEKKNGSLLVEVANKTQSLKIVQIKKLDNLDVVVTPDPWLNYTKGTIRSEVYCEIEKDILLQELKKFEVVDIYKQTKKVNGEISNNGIMILTFDSCDLPQNVKIAWTKFEVRQYIPYPRQCYKCQKFNHSSRTCRSSEDTCQRCGESGHQGQSCINPFNCANCEEAHQANNRSCLFYQLEKEIISVQTLEKMEYREARQKIMKKSVSENKTFADALREKSQTNRRPPQPVHETTRIPIQSNQIENRIQNTSNRNKINLSDNENEVPKKKSTTMTYINTDMVMEEPPPPSTFTLQPPTSVGAHTPAPTRQTGEGIAKALPSTTVARELKRVTPSPSVSKVTSSPSPTAVSEEQPKGSTYLPPKTAISKQQKVLPHPPDTIRSTVVTTSSEFKFQHNPRSHSKPRTADNVKSIPSLGDRPSPRVDHHRPSRSTSRHRPPDLEYEEY